jgi:hypothetical protein
MTIVRTPTRLEGGITDEERARLEIHAKRWIDIAYQTGRTNRQKLVKAIEGLYRVANLKKPAVEIVPSPKAMVERFATCVTTNAATRNATRSATDDATYAATRDATRYATYAATDTETRDATYAATDTETRDATFAATFAATLNAAYDFSGWRLCYHGGNAWAPYDCYFTAFRDVLGLRLSQYEKYHFWEEAALYGGFRVMLPKRCIVSDFPDILRVDSQWRPHCDSGPSHRWSDGWSLWYLHGIAVDEQIVLRPETQTIQQMDNEKNADVQAIRIERYGWPRYLRETGATCLDERRNDIDGTREALFQDRRGRLRLVVTCPTARVFAPSVPAGIASCEQAQNWLAGEKPFRSLART